MAHIIVLGAGTGGMPAAYELREELGSSHEITVVNERDYFQFVPSNPWIAVGWRKRKDITFPIEKYLNKKNINFVHARCDKIDAENSKLELSTGETLEYDYLLITTGPKLSFGELEGSGPEENSHSVCTVSHAEMFYKEYQELLAKGSGTIAVGAAPGASCFGPAYEFAFIIDTDLRKRKIRDKFNIQFVSSEPYIGHLGLGGVGDSKGMLESAMRARHIPWIINAKTTKIDPGVLHVEEYNEYGDLAKTHEVKADLTMMLPAFFGVDVVTKVEGLCNPRGFVFVDEHQRNPTYKNIYSAGVCIAIPPVETTPVATGTPKTGYMIESMVTAIVHNIENELKGKEPSYEGTWATICLADMGNTGAAFVAIPQIPPRNLAWFKEGKWVHYAKIAFEKYFIRKMKQGSSEPFYEKSMLKLMGITRLK
ncbi:MAG TPA: NAD(P)/FAD-dependent oxidoreductase [Thiothrix sp.]|nr:NAD(P)/FAD-dependent oxidoreductase [Thiothrix sp.]